ncbi:uncharacterized protein LACBIDRAFT_314267 [Laccaria bicolor S238N-H82]|uniref:Predicted protein n=1 Tax=Laccaria bicolor (strain S238N-H82 / ATCC MYA-4686) TaxID=486041 RepID=B0D1Y7_LACBS|nr:uncharacterized protein LACBIDRAFT_314267 [Laccaria bicolor S238N-H82]EDR11723.1 predicted protein [Laccaria bicolor S238N-H82]|eukprot:XP_001877620.1 predicted protein [Laccaria bicolor S238N-H82]
MITQLFFQSPTFRARHPYILSNVPSHCSPFPHIISSSKRYKPYHKPLNTCLQTPENALHSQNPSEPLLTHIPTPSHIRFAAPKIDHAGQLTNISRRSRSEISETDACRIWIKAHSPTRVSTRIW